MFYKWGLIVSARIIPNIGRVAEKNIAKRISGRTTVASGGGPIHDKGDVSKDDYLIEVKATKNDSMSIKKHWLDKITYEASQISKYPALAVQFVDGSGNLVPNGSWIMVKEDAFIEFCKEQEQ